MVLKWRISFPIVAFVLTLLIAGCGSEEPTENDPEENQNQNQPENQEESCVIDEDCDADNPYCIGERCFPDPPIDCEDNEDCISTMPYCVSGVCFDRCVTNDECSGLTPICDGGECVEDPDQEGECADDADCLGDNYCHELTCVSRDHICLLKNCGGQRGVCDPSAGADGQCVNADFCNSTLECVEGFRCLTNECVPEEEACAECEENEECEIEDPSSDVVTCFDPDVVCEPGLRECDDDFLIVCSDDGTTQQTIPCNLGCNEDTLQCELPEGQFCESPFMMENGDTMEIAWSEYSNNYDPDPETNCVSQANDLRTTGADITYGLELEPGEVGVVELTTALDYAVLYMLDDCSQGADYCRTPDGHQVEQLQEGGSLRSLWYENSGSETEVIYVIADSGPGAAGRIADVEVTISEQICTPSTPVCNDGQLGECSTYGTHYVTDPQRECSMGCLSEDPDDALCVPEDHSTCDDAIHYDGEQIEFFEGTIIDFHPDQTIDALSDCGSGANIGGGQAADFEGPTAYFSVDLAQAERLNATLSSQFEAGLWIANDCNDGQCLQAHNESDDMEHLEFTAGLGGGSFLVVVQAVDADVEAGDFMLELSTDQPLCESHDPGHVLGCVDDEFLQYCVNSDYPERHDCGGPCTDDQCEVPTGDQCFDTIALNDGDTFNGSFGDVSAVLTPVSCSGNHDFEDPIGPETIFEMELEEGGQLINVDLDSNSSDAGVYLLDSCPVGNDDVSNQCVDGAVPTDEVSFFIEEAGTYYLVVDSANRHDAAQFSVSVDLTPGECVPDAVRCSGGNIERCKAGDEPGEEDVIYRVEQACVVGCQDDPIACVGPEDANNRCGPSNSYPISQSGQLIDNFDRFDQQENLAAGECFEDGTEGPDAFYQLNLDPLQGVSIHATVDIDDSGSHDLGMYIADECITDASDPEESCLNAVTFGGSDVLESSIDYYAPEGGQFTLGLAGLSDFESGEFILDFEFFDGECDPSEDNSCDGDTAVQCTSVGQLEEVECEFGCGDGQCLEQEGNFCVRPFDIDDLGSIDAQGTITYEHSDNIGLYENAYSPFDTESNSSCTGNVGHGPDAVFSFEGWAGDELNAVLDSQFDGALWLTTNCDEAAGHCVVGADDVFGAGVEELSYAIESQATYFLIVDSVQTGATGGFDLDITIEPGDRLTDPAIFVDDEPLSWTLEVEDSATDIINIANGGEMALDFDIDDGDADWLTVTPDTGTIGNMDDLDVDLAVTCPVDPGTYTTTLVITSNDPHMDTVEIDVELICEPPPTPATLDVNDDPISWTLELEESDTTELDIANSGDLELTFSIDDGDADWLDVDPDSGAVDGQDSVTVELTATCPTDPGTHNTTLDITTNNGDAQIDVELNCEEPPSPATLDVNDEPISWTLDVEESATTELDIANSGDLELTFDIDDGDVDWLGVDPDSGAVDGQDSVTVELTATCPTDPGTHSTTLDITTNNGDAQIDVELTCEESGSGG